MFGYPPTYPQRAHEARYAPTPLHHDDTARVRELEAAHAQMVALHDSLNGDDYDALRDHLNEHIHDMPARIQRIRDDAFCDYEAA